MMPFTGSWTARPGQPGQQQTQTAAAAAATAAAAAVRAGHQFAQAPAAQAAGHQFAQAPEAQAAGHQFAQAPAAQAAGHQFAQAPAAQAAGHQFAQAPAAQAAGHQFAHAPAAQAAGPLFAQALAAQAAGPHYAQAPAAGQHFAQTAGHVINPASAQLMLPPVQPCFSAAPWGAALTPKKPQYEGEMDECSVCVDNGETMHLFATCRHYPFCSKCIEIMSQGTPGCLKCPVCRAVVKDVRIIIKVRKTQT